METPRRTTARRDPIDVVWACLAVGIPVLASLLSRMDTVDLAYHLRAGQDVLAGSIPRVDTYTFTAAGSPWLDQQWLAQGILAAVDRVGGWASLAALQALLIGVTFLLLYLAIRSGSATPRTASLLTLGGFLVASPGLALRPQLVALPLFAALLLITVRRDRHPAGLWAAPVLAALCANVHGSFVLFPLVVVLAWLEDVRLRAPGAKRTLLIAVVATAATVLTPFGPRAWSYAFDLSTNPVIRHTITEWAPLTLGSAAGWLAIGCSSRRSPTSSDVRPDPLDRSGDPRCVLPPRDERPTGVGVVGHDRARGGGRTDRDGSGPRGSSACVRPGAELPSTAYAIVGVVLAAIVALLPWWRGDDPARLLPKRAIRRHRSCGPTPCRHEDPGVPTVGLWFGYANPSDPVFVDSRIEVPPREAWDDYAKVASGDAQWSAMLDRWKVDAIVAPNDWGPVPLLEAPGSGWRVAYRDGESTLFRRA